MLVFTDGIRCRTEAYSLKGSVGRVFSIAERIRGGALVTDFGEHGEVVDQNVLHGIEPMAALSEHLKTDALEKSNEPYKRVEIGIFCRTCNRESKAVRELDTKDPQNMGSVPVVPIFACIACNTKYYSMTEDYLDRLVGRNISLFEKEEVAAMSKDADAFKKELQEYIIRIFASKRIFRLEIKE